MSEYLSTIFSASSWAAAAAGGGVRRSAARISNTTWRSRSGKIQRKDRANPGSCLRDLRRLRRRWRRIGIQPHPCLTCQGFGKVRASQGFFTIERTCMTCQGRGEIIQKPCQACAGSGRVTRERTLSVNIPASVRDSTRIRLAGEGEAGIRGGPAGDLYIFLSILPDEIFQRDGADLFCRVPITMATAALGGTG